MKEFTLILIVVISGTMAAICTPGVAMAQVTLERQVIASAGISGTSGDFIVQTTLGELVVSTVSSGQTILTQGFQQPEIFLIPIPPVEGELITGVIIYPNPASVEAQLEFDLQKNGSVQVMLVNNAGQLVHNVQMDAPKGRVKHLIPLGGRYAAGMYYVLLKVNYETHTEKLIVQ